jgi:hypothetical protein
MSDAFSTYTEITFTNSAQGFYMIMNGNLVNYIR